MVDDEEFRELFLAQYERLCWLGLLLSGSAAEAEELAQEALTRTFGRWSSQRPEDPAAYARRVLVNAYRSRLRRLLVEARLGFRASQPAVYLPDLGEDAMKVEERLARAFRRPEGLAWPDPVAGYARFHRRRVVAPGWSGPRPLWPR